MKDPIITAEMLEARGAYKDWVKEFRAMHPSGLTVISAWAVSVAETFAWGWAAEILLSFEALQEYRMDTDPAWDKFVNEGIDKDILVSEQLLKKYKMECAQAFARLFIKQCEAEK